MSWATWGRRSRALVSSPPPRAHLTRLKSQRLPGSRLAWRQTEAPAFRARGLPPGLEDRLVEGVEGMGRHDPSRAGASLNESTSPTSLSPEVAVRRGVQPTLNRLLAATWSRSPMPRYRPLGAPPGAATRRCAVWCTSTKVPASRCNAAEMCSVTLGVGQLTGALSHRGQSEARPLPGSLASRPLSARRSS